MIQRRRDRVSVQTNKRFVGCFCRLRLSNEIYKHRRSIFNFKKNPMKLQSEWTHSLSRTKYIYIYKFNSFTWRFSLNPRSFVCPLKKKIKKAEDSDDCRCCLYEGFSHPTTTKGEVA